MQAPHHPLPGTTAALLVAAGGAAGALARYGLALLLTPVSRAWPLGTLAANVAGCFVMGALASLGAALPTPWRLLLATGFCGGFTTLSALAYETLALGRDHGPVPGGAYLVVSLTASILAFAAGAALARAVARS